MREFIGHVLKVIADNFPTPVEGVMVDDKPNLILLRSPKDGKVTRVVKSHISGFMPMDFEPADYVPFHVLACEDKESNCPGMQYVVEGEGFKKSDFEVFMGPCPCRRAECRFGSKGELRTVNGAFLSRMISGTMFGEYPSSKKETKHGNDSSKAGSKAGTGSGKAAPARGPRESEAGRPGALEEGSDGQAEM